MSEEFKLYTIKICTSDVFTKTQVSNNDTRQIPDRKSSIKKKQVMSSLYIVYI